MKPALKNVMWSGIGVNIVHVTGYFKIKNRKRG